MIRTIIVEDNRFMMNYLRGILREDNDFQLEAALSDAFLAEEICKEQKIDLVIMDVQTLHNHSGLAAGERIREKNPATKVLIVTSLIDPEILSRAKAGGADSLWYKDHGKEDLLDVIRRTVAGEHVFPDTSPSVELKDMFSGDISPRQIDILRMFVKGFTYDEIAAEVKISKNGVRWNLDQIVEKGGFANKHEMLAAIIENKLIVTTLEERGE
ncbi:MAG: response regulator transcription factor [Lachnospiraceae bacterium]|nr:response regulator transcription factor [Lachnospiraceae bacterium]